MVTSKETRAAIIALQKPIREVYIRQQDCTSVNYLSNYQELQRGIQLLPNRLQGPMKAQKAPGPSPQAISAAGSGHHECKAYLGMAAGMCECICTRNKVKTIGRQPGV